MPFFCATIEKIAKGQRRTHRHSNVFFIMRCTPPHTPSGRALRDDSRLQNIKKKSYLFSSGSVEKDFPKTSQDFLSFVTLHVKTHKTREMIDRNIRTLIAPGS